MEMWKEIPSTGGALEVSNLGRVRSNLRDGRILRLSEDKKGYLRVRATIQREKMCFKVHREVAKAFIQNPNGLPQVNHKDGNKKNNSAENLEWVSNEENARHAIENGLWENVFAASSRSNELRKIKIRSIDSDTGEVRYFESVSAAERFFGSRHISDVLNGKRTKAAGQYFERG